MKKMVFKIASISVSSLMILCFVVYMYLSLLRFPDNIVCVSNSISWRIFKIAVIILHFVLLYFSDSTPAYAFSFFSLIPAFTIFSVGLPFSFLVLLAQTVLSFVCRRKVIAIIGTFLFLIFSFIMAVAWLFMP